MLMIVKLSVYSVLTYLVMLFITVLRPKSENNLLLEEIPNHPIKAKFRTILKAPNMDRVLVPNNVNLSCLRENASLIVVVKSKIDNFGRRQNIRWKYWCRISGKKYVSK